MPIYEYKCRECGSKFEMLVRSFAATGIKCPKCGGEQTEKMLSVFATSSRVGECGFSPSSGSPCGTGGLG